MAAGGVARRACDRPAPAEAGRCGGRPARRGRAAVIVAGRGAVLAGAREPRWSALAERTGALLATSAMVTGCSPATPATLGITGGFASPLAAELLPQADLVVAFGAALNALDHASRRADRRRRARGAGRRRRSTRSARTRRSTLGVSATCARPRRRCWPSSASRGHRARRLARRRESAAAIAGRRWRDEPFDDASDAEHVDPRALHDRARRAAARGAHGRRRLRPLHGLPGDVPARAGRGRLRLHPGLPVDRPGPRRTRSAPRSRGRTGWPWRRSATAAR